MTAEEFLKTKGIKDTLFNVELNEGWIKGGLSKLLEEYAQSKAGEFAEWMRDERYQRYWGNDKPNNDKWFKAFSNPNRIYYTTAELYNIFNQQT